VLARFAKYRVLLRILAIWRKGWDSNPRYPCRHAGFQDRCLKPLGHPSLRGFSIAYRKPLANAMRTWTQLGPNASYFARKLEANAAIADATEASAFIDRFRFA
jgi:hypothetical protein